MTTPDYHTLVLALEPDAYLHASNANDNHAVTLPNRPQGANYSFWFWGKDPEEAWEKAYQHLLEQHWKGALEL